ncbi:MAG: hypothetical protein CML67_06230 [Rhodobacteraceae bacterium]|nr:hypothetical protein [Paracoccaceae bacterium]
MADLSVIQKFFRTSLQDKFGEPERIKTFLRSAILRIRRQGKTDKYEYPYTLINPHELSPAPVGLEEMFLVGESWKEPGGKKPIALLVGFNDWKFGFVADFLSDYRCAFAPMKKNYFFFAGVIRAMIEKPKIVYIWGYNEPYFLLSYLKKKNIAYARVEDGFVRSAQLGAIHTTPYSLVFDYSGVLHYDHSAQTDLEDVLNHYDFQSNPKLLQQAEELISLLCRLGISKYNPPLTTENDPFKKFTGKKRVAVIGQVDKDMSMRKGNVDGWTMEDIIEIAAFENPTSEIIYRPHPEIYKGLHKSKTRLSRVQKICRLASPEEGLPQFLDGIDHVYVVTSLSGLEALLRGKKVTVFGAPFYAGWGLTDDRATLLRRKRQLSLAELFAGSYLIYAKYLGALDDSYIGLMAAIRRISADRIVITQKTHKSLVNETPRKDVLKSTVQSSYWPAFLFAKKGQAHENFDELICQAPFHRTLKAPGCRIYQSVLLHAVCGVLNSDDARNRFLNKVRQFIAPDIYADFLTRLGKIRPKNTDAIQWAWLLEQLKEVPKSFELMEAQYNRTGLAADDNDDGGPAPSEPLPQTLEQVALLYSMCERAVEHRDYEKALDHVLTLMLNGNLHSGLLLPAIKIADLTFDTTSVRLLSDMLKYANISGHNNAGVNYHVECLSTTPGDETLEDILESFSLQLVLNPDRVNRTLARLNEFLGRSNAAALSHAILAMDGSRSVRLANAWLELSRPQKALTIMTELIEMGDRSDTALVAFSRALAGVGDYQRAVQVMEQAVARDPCKATYTELLRLLKILGHFETAHQHFLESVDLQIDLPLEGPVMPIFFGLRQIERGFRCFLNTAMRDRLIAYYGAEKYQNSEELQMEDLLLICDFGPAEEIRYSVLLSEIGDRFGYDTFSLCCDPRLLPLLSRSFPQVRLTPVRRTREFSAEFPHREFDRLPGADLRRVLDNNGHEAVEKADKIMLFTEIIWHFRKDYSDFKRTPYLKPDPVKASAFRERLPKNTRLVGLSWRSQLTNAMRNVHYLDIEELEPLFALKDITFVNLQYDDCEEELDWVRERYPGKIINLEDIDQYNDFDSVAALMSNLDLVIGPGTAVIELAGATGTPGLLFSNHGETWWREIGPERSDVWYECVRLLRGDPGDKSSIVAALVEEVENWSKQNPKPVEGHVARNFSG